MKLTFLRALAFASLSLFAFGNVAAHAEDAPKMSRGVSKMRQDISKSVEAKDWPTAVAKIREAQKTEDMSDYEKFVLSVDLAYSCFQAGDHACATDAYIAAAQFPGMPADKHEMVVKSAIRLLAGGKDFQRIVDFAKAQLTDAMMDDVMARIVSASYYQLEDYPNALLYGQKAVDLAKAAGREPDRDRYSLILSCYVRLKDMPAQIKTVNIMTGLFGTSEDWQRTIDLALGSLTTGRKDVAALFLYRLRLVVKADSVAADYMAAADLGLDQRMPGAPGDAVKALTAAQAAGESNAKVNAALVKARGMAKADQATLGAAKAEVMKSPKAAVVARVAEAYFSYDNYAEAEQVALLAADKPGASQNELLLIAGAAQAMQGKNDEAVATLAKVKGDAALALTANIWTVYATRTYDKPKPEPAPAPAPAK